MYACYFWMLREELRDFHRVFRMRTHAPWQCAHPTQNQPAIERRWDSAAFILNTADPLKKFIIFFGDDNSSENVTMSAEIFCCGIQDQVGAEIEWSLQHRRPCVVTNKSRSGVVRDFSKRSQIDNFQQRIGRGFGPRELCIWAQRFLDCGEIAHVDEIGLKPPTHKDFADQSRRAVVRIDVREDVI